MSRYKLFDRRGLHLEDLSIRGHDLHWSDCHPLDPPAQPYDHPQLPELIERIMAARRNDRPVILIMGAHPIKLGLSRYLIDLLDRRLVTHIATNGAGVIHDFELALAGGTSEDVAKWIAVGQFGLWRQTGRLNDIIHEAACRQEGLGEAVGRVIQQEGFPFRQLSVAAAAWRVGVPLTAHVAVGCDIIHGLPNCDPMALGQATYTDFLIFVASVEQLDGGVLLNLGTAVMGPEIYLKALSLARNVARQRGEHLHRFTTAVFDLMPLRPQYEQGLPSKDHPQYYFRPWKTILVRTLSDGATGYCFTADHRQTIPSLWHGLVRQDPSLLQRSSSEPPGDRDSPSAD